MQQTPLTILTGFLGSGKTTLLRHILTQNHGVNITTIVNDFGVLNIDEEIISSQGGTQIALANGCVCCTIGDDLGRTLHDVMSRTLLPERIIIEASGISDPARIAAFTYVDRSLKLAPILCCVDSSAYLKQSNDIHLADTMEKQVRAADIFLLTKGDLLGDDASKQFETAFAPNLNDRPFYWSVQGQVDLSLLFETDNNQLTPEHAHDPTLLETAQPYLHTKLVSYSGHLPPINAQTVKDNIATLGPYVLRAKGVLTDDDGAYIYQYASGRSDVERSNSLDPSNHFVILCSREVDLTETIFAHFSEKSVI
jgi:G3E family GTPase